MTYQACPNCHNKYCPAIGNGKFLCPLCNSIFRATSFESGVRATSLAFHLMVKRIMEE